MKQLILLALLFIGEAFLSDAYGSVTQSIPMHCQLLTMLIRWCCLMKMA